MKIPVLSYHSINNNNSPISLKTNFFENQLKYLKKKGYKTIDFHEIEKKENKTIIITFDDGYKDIFYNALPF
jgi:Predicted xylanase/chitin deacetylase